MSNISTPRTDAETMRDEYDHVDTEFGPYTPSDTVSADFARQLERELTEMREMFKDYVESVSELLHEDTSDACAEHHNNLHEKAKEVLGL